MTAYAGLFSSEAALTELSGGFLGLDRTDSITIYQADGITVASLYTDYTKSHAAPNPLTPASDGNFSFYADPGRYWATTASRSVIVNVPVAIEDFTGFATDSAVVHKAGTETVTGAKDFTGGITDHGAALLPASQKGAADGVASLDASALVPDAQIPPAIARDSEVTAAVATETSRATTAEGLLVPRSYLDTDGTLAANSDTKLATQKAVKTYADALVGATDAMVFKGVIDCSANPNYPAADRGNTYKVSVAGKIGGASGLNVEVGDLLICLTDGTASGNQATVGANWSIVQANIDGAVTGPASSTDGDFAFYNGAGGKVIKDSGVSLDTDGTLAANSDSRVASQKAVKTALAAETTRATAAEATNATAISAETTRATAAEAARAMGLVPTAVKTANYTAVASDFVPVDTTSGAVTVTLPTAPADKTRVGVKQVIQGGTNTVTVARGGTDVFNKAGGSTTLTLTLVNQALTVQYASATGIWYVISDDLALTTLDTRYDAAGLASAEQTRALAAEAALAKPELVYEVAFDTTWSSIQQFVTVLQRGDFIAEATTVSLHFSGSFGVRGGVSAGLFLGIGTMPGGGTPNNSLLQDVVGFPVNTGVTLVTAPVLNLGSIGLGSGNGIGAIQREVVLTGLVVGHQYRWEVYVGLSSGSDYVDTLDGACGSVAVSPDSLLAWVCRPTLNTLTCFAIGETDQFAINGRTGRLTKGGDLAVVTFPNDLAMWFTGVLGVAGYTNGQMAVYNSYSGAQLGTTQTAPAGVHAVGVTAAAGKFYFTCDNGHVYVVDVAGTAGADIDTGVNTVLGYPCATTGGTAVVVPRPGQNDVVIIDPTTDTVTRTLALTSAVACDAVDANRVMVLSSENPAKVTRLHIVNGVEATLTTADGLGVRIATTPDGYGWWATTKTPAHNPYGPTQKDTAYPLTVFDHATFPGPITALNDIAMSLNLGSILIACDTGLWQYPGIKMNAAGGTHSFPTDSAMLVRGAQAV